MSKLWLNEAMLQMDKKFYKNVLNVLNGYAGSGKSTFVFNEFLRESYKYVNGMRNKYYYAMNLNKVLYVCDTNMLKSSILEDNKDITKILSKGDLKQAMNDKTIEQIIDGDIGHIKVITYSTLGWLLKQDGAKHIILNYIQVIIMDEMHNLFKYAKRFDSIENGKLYSIVIEYLSTLLKNNTLLIALSATTGRIYNGIRDININTNTVFKIDELKQIRQYENRYTKQTNNIWNDLKIIGLQYDMFKKMNIKIFIYTNTINQSEKYKKFLIKSGYKAEWLCSINNSKEIININEDGTETTEKVPTMSKEQIAIRNQLIKTGMLPDNLDIIIVNSGYETGWNLRDNRIQYVYIDSIDYDTQIQARNRVRHDIEHLCIKVRVTDEGEILELDQFMNEQRTGEFVPMPRLTAQLDNKYIGVKLSNEDKKELVNKYGVYYFNMESINWKTFKKDLKRSDLIVKVEAHGTYIYKEGQEIKKDVKKMENENLLVSWIENEWDKSRITIQDVKDILDMGTKTFNKLMKSETIIEYFKNNRYTICTPKGTKTKYLKKY